MIPKKIHYIWLGNNKKDRVSKICINSWKANLKGYEIIEWNERNLPINEIAAKNLFFAKCMKYKLWAFMSDYLRLWILYREGGIYLDTDVEVLKEFDSLLNYPMFLGYEINDYLGTGIIGADKENPFVNELLKFYDDRIWHVGDYKNPVIFSNVLKENKEMNKYCKILPRDMLSPFDPFSDVEVERVGSDDTYTIHWFNANWGMTRKGYVFLNTKQYSGVKKAVEVMRKNIGYELRKLGIKQF